MATGGSGQPLQPERDEAIMSDMGSTGEFDEFDVTENDFDAMMVEADPARVVTHPLRGLQPALYTVTLSHGGGVASDQYRGVLTTVHRSHTGASGHPVSA
jgi:hypothetical protein